MLLHIVERLEGLLSKLPATIQKPILHELTPLKELFLQQRPPRFILAGSIKRPPAEIVSILFDVPEATVSNAIFRWQNLSIGGHGTMAILDARGAAGSAETEIRDELKQQPADIILFLDEGDDSRRARKTEIENLRSCLSGNGPGLGKVVGISFHSEKTKSHGKGKTTDELTARLKEVIQGDDQLLESIPVYPGEKPGKSFMSIICRNVPNQARIEMIRISRDREAQRQVAQILVKSTSAICTAVGAQPIPLADLPILTTLQLVMVSGIMYLSGRERSLRAATEFIGAIGANVGAGMLFREGARVLLKFLPGWGNVICGVVAGAGTYAIGRAAIAFFLEGVSIKEARRMYLASKKKRSRAELPPAKRSKRKRLIKQ
ncbi:MAG TPA: hypothetical protein VEI58_01575 [Chthoniobacterales bacterium]|nr:hypothetical protein [Chthoniobacterales bacterium]